MRYLILHGWQGSGPGHWQAWLAEELAAAGHDVAFPTLPDPDHPQLDAWLDALAPLRRPDDVVVCHSAACCLWLHHRDRGGPLPQRALLVAPPMPAPMLPEIASFFPVPLRPELAERCRVVSAPDDPYCPGGAHRAFVKPLAAASDCIPGGGHLNPDAGYGAWPAVLAWAQGAKNGVET